MQTYLEKRQPAKSAARFYRMTVLPNLFGEWVLNREWGRIPDGGKGVFDQGSCPQHDDVGEVPASAPND